jgi:hypothetical protein
MTDGLEECPQGLLLKFDGDFGMGFYMDCAECGDRETIEDESERSAQAEFLSDGWHHVRRPEPSVDKDAWVCPECWQLATAGKDARE